MDLSPRHEQGPPSQKERQDFLEAMHAEWDLIRLHLHQIRPPGWLGFRFTATFNDHPGEQQFSVQSVLEDPGSDKFTRGPAVAHVEQMVARLYLKHRDFDPLYEWKRIIVEQVWNSDESRWNRAVTEWEYRY